MEFCDYDFRYRADDGSLTPDLAMIQNQYLVMESSQRLGREPCPGPKLKQWVEDSGFINVTERCYPLPIGVWAKDKKLVSTRNAHAHTIPFLKMLNVKCSFANSGPRANMLTMLPERSRLVEPAAVPPGRGSMVYDIAHPCIRLETARSPSARRIHS